MKIDLNISTNGKPHVKFYKIGGCNSGKQYKRFDY